jgi:hypothetical protein
MQFGKPLSLISATLLTFMDTWFLQAQLGIDLRDYLAEEFCTAILQKAAKQRKYSCVVRI